MGDAVTALLDLRFDPVRVSEAMAILGSVIAQTRDFEGCLKAEVLEDCDDAAHVVVLEQWASAEHDHAYRQWRAGAGKDTRLGGVLGAAPALTKFQSATL